VGKLFKNIIIGMKINGHNFINEILSLHECRSLYIHLNLCFELFILYDLAIFNLFKMRSF
jgi:hypothetical protein